MTDHTKETLVGAAVFTALVLVLLFSYGGGELRARAKAGTGYVVTAAFNKVDGLYVGDEVQMGGIRVGRVDSLTLTDTFRVVAALRIDPHIALPLDSSVAIHTDGLFGAKFVVLEPGGELDTLKDGARIEYTQDAVVVSDLLDLIISQGRARLAEEKAEGEDGPGKERAQERAQEPGKE